ncbi:MAG: peptidoglycan DD-metalloendopeptidase family protein [Candidatus Pacebacteria bacterium]|nr:peptidoglycan DD-metalloendopeptidase family protein [Candidatus Paceibacterota bacterium]
MASTLSVGLFFTPTPEARAGFLSGVFSDASASTASGSLTGDVGNSQNMTLLQANSFSIPTPASKNSKDSNEIDESVDVSILSNNALLPATGPMGVSDGTVIPDDSFDQISVYVVRSGDTVSQVANMFGVTPDTILSANDMKKGDKLKEGDVLLILPFSGIEHTVTKGQTIQGIANLYKVDVNEILLSNDMEIGTKLSIGEKLIIPGGTLQNTTSPAKPSGASSGLARSNPSQGSLKNANGYFINPVPSARKSRGTTSAHKGVDLAAPIGTPIKAAAAGRVSFARTGYNGGFGNLVIITHSNGTETLYAHQNSIATSVGAQVTQGQVIGYVGNTGRSRGAHLHFEVHGAKNPGNDWSWKY